MATTPSLLTGGIRRTSLFFASESQFFFRYADDFVILHENQAYLKNLIPKISAFLETRLKLSLHPNKVLIKTLASGIDFLGWISFPSHRLPRTSTKQRMFKKLKQNFSSATIASYLGLLSHGNTYKLSLKIKNNIQRFEHR